MNSFESIAERIGKVGRGEVRPLTEITGFSFPPDYSIDKSSCWRAWRRAIIRAPLPDVKELRGLSFQRLEHWFPLLGASITSGDRQSIETALKILKQEVSLFGLSDEKQQSVPSEPRSVIARAFQEEPDTLVDYFSKTVEILNDLGIKTPASKASRPVVVRHFVHCDRLSLTDHIEVKKVA